MLRNLSSLVVECQSAESLNIFRFQFVNTGCNSKNLKKQQKCSLSKRLGFEIIPKYGKRERPFSFCYPVLLPLDYDVSLDCNHNNLFHVAAWLVALCGAFFSLQSGFSSASSLPLSRVTWATPQPLRERENVKPHERQWWRFQSELQNNILLFASPSATSKSHSTPTNILFSAKMLTTVMANMLTKIDFGGGPPTLVCCFESKTLS